MAEGPAAADAPSPSGGAPAPVDGPGPDAVLSALVDLAASAGIEVRVEPFHLTMAGKGGLCRIGTRRVILVDAKLSVLEQIGVVAEALGAALPKSLVAAAGSSARALVPYLETGHAKVRRLARPRPLARGR